VMCMDTQDAAEHERRVPRRAKVDRLEQLALERNRAFCDARRRHDVLGYCQHACAERGGWERQRTLGSGVSPDTTHSSSAGGPSMDVALTAATSGADTTLTTNWRVVAMLVPLSLRPTKDRESVGGLVPTYCVP
jgi:hypothetical protein